MLLTDSPGWNSLQALRSHLSGRLARFTRAIAPSAPVKARKWRNDAAFLDAGLRYIITATPATIEQPDNDSSEIDQTALNLLSSLNDIVNNDLVKPSQAPERHSQDGMANLGDQYPGLNSLVNFIEYTPGEYNLITGPRALFKLPENQIGKTEIDRVIASKELLERSILGAKEPKNVNLPTVQQPDTPESPLAQEKPDLQQRTASAVIDAIFKDFRQRDCGISHEVKLGISDEWQSDTHQAAFDMFISVCHEMVWQEAKCGSFSEKNSICDAIHRAQANGKVLHIVVDQQGLFDITDKMPAVMSSVDKEISSREKALLALSLARCLMDFFNQDLELGLYSWKPESLYFLRFSGTQPGHRALYISLKPKESAAESSGSFYGVGPGNPVLLSFAKLLLEIDSGDTIPIEIQPESKANLSKWAEMCDFVSVAEREGSANYLKAVEGCLYLHMALPKFLDQEGSPVTDQILRKAIYEQVVRNLELMANPETSKRKRRDSVSDLPLSKKLSLAPPFDQQPSVGLPAQKPTRPSTRNEFEVAIVCALSLEFNAVSTLVDEFWDEDGEYYGRADGDTNIYTTGRIGKSNLVLVLLAGMGKVSAAAAAASFRSSYPGLRLALVTGICGGVPYLADSEELLLGDVVISKRIVQYDFGKQYPDGFSTRTAVEDSLGRASKHIRNLLAVFETDLARDRLERKAAVYPQQIQDSTSTHYQHKHRRSAQCSCAETTDSSSSVCNESRTLSCDELGCDRKYLVRRERLECKRQLEAEGRIKEAQAPSVYAGSIGSGDAVIKSGGDRDRIAKVHDLATFEMEGAGVWEEIPCIVVKAVCDYADSHKNKSWQHFAAAAAASTTKALLERYIQTGKLLHGGLER
ncbi:5'-methylthioadenosine/S-adenosylhomocysteine nucleosidase family protein [Aspergillus lucknowensis]|uniref:Nucleoside phosphorylase domain-containing protein n=1 Tax=Aspergillus lucknowensis TaxID=176173 RepID=A0ABR4L623_9EURO